MVRAGLPTPEVNLPVAVQSAGTVYHVDMGYRVERIGVEFDGAVHVGNRRQMEIDAMRRRHLQDDGWLIITVTATQLAAPGPFLRSIEQALILRRSVRAWL
jgi:very-short-patch-repair endonuclease